MRVGWFSSGRGPGSQALLAAACDAIEHGGLPVEIAYVFCNRARGEHEPADRFLDLAASHGLPTITLSSAAFRRSVGGTVARAGEALPAWRVDYDRAVLRLLQPFGTRMAVLAGYQLVAPELCRHFDLINLHPAAPGGPVGLWQEVIWRLIEQQAGESGATILLATPELDAGPPVSFCTYSLRDERSDPLWQALGGRDSALLQETQGEQLPLFVEIRRRGAMREAPLLVATLDALAKDRIRLVDGQVVDVAGRETEPLDLTDQVDRTIARTV